ncbi:MAG: Uma2 family endonuclease [Acaryochloris sp. RU_4_1]|nr:Uma2 family endonuclease [Acaryochloris sp. RU_4_1]NJN37642.1 Uma2 family endonuclease [Acaryochloridaceae cyanobacterium CSU_3_4]NJR56203.1 Uma2 family endonuclease [Acaryochloris sp. CRU_2_0]
MTTSTTQRMTLEEYLTYDDGTDTRYELVDGVLVPMGTENPINPQITGFLFALFLGLGIPHYRLVIGHQIEVISAHATARQPDLIVHSQESEAAILQDGKLLRYDSPVPLLVVEVVSNSDTDKKSRDRDYQEKRSEYEARRIPEYWIIDPAAAVVLVLTFNGTKYEEQRSIDDQHLISPSFPDLQVTAAQVLRAGK